MSDLISRADAIERIANDNVVGGMKRINEYRDSTEHNDYLDGISTAIATVEDIPSADAVTHEIRTETHGVCLISKDDAMGAVQDHFNDNGFKGYDDGQKMMDRIKALPSAEAYFTDGNKIAEWIPCSERLPSEDGLYLIQTNYMYHGIHNMDVYYWAEGWNCIRLLNGMVKREYEIDGVVAWMPLPKPWKGEDDE